MIVALQHTDPTIPTTIITDSRYVVDGLTKHLGTWEDRGWTGVRNATWFQAAAYQLRRRAAPTNFKWVQGHARTLGNERADALANQGARKDQLDLINCDVPACFRLPEIKLTTLTQRIAYQAIRECQNATYTQNTVIHLDITRYAIHEITGHLETDTTLWRNLRHPDLRRTIQNFFHCAMTGSPSDRRILGNHPGLRTTCKLLTLPRHHRITCTYPNRMQHG